MSEVEKSLDTSSSEAAPVEAVAAPAAASLLCRTTAKTKSILQQALPVTQKALTSVAYNGGYYVAFGVTFPTLFAVHMIPGGLRLVSGFVDGAVAAKDYLDNLQAAKAAHPVAAAEAS